MFAGRPFACYVVFLHEKSSDQWTKYRPGINFSQNLFFCINYIFYETGTLANFRNRGRGEKPGYRRQAPWENTLGRVDVTAPTGT